MISVEGLTVEFGGFTLFDDVSFVVNKKDRIALVGKNGAGKIYDVEDICRFAVSDIRYGEYSQRDDDRLSAATDAADR